MIDKEDVTLQIENAVGHTRDDGSFIVDGKATVTLKVEGGTGVAATVHVTGREGDMQAQVKKAPGVTKWFDLDLTKKVERAAISAVLESAKRDGQPVHAEIAEE